MHVLKLGNAISIQLQKEIVMRILRQRKKKVDEKNPPGEQQTRVLYPLAPLSSYSLSNSVAFMAHRHLILMNPLAKYNPQSIRVSQTVAASTTRFVVIVAPQLMKIQMKMIWVPCGQKQYKAMSGSRRGKDI